MKDDDNADLEPQSLPASDTTSNRLKRLLPKVVFVLALAAAVTFAGLWWQERASSNMPQPSAAVSEDKSADGSQTEQPCTDAFTHYTNKDFKLEFCYPEGWGDVKVSADSGPVAESGSYSSFGFTNIERRLLSLPTHDWQMLAGHGGCGFPPPRTADQIDSWDSGGWTGTSGTPDETAYSWPSPDDGSSRLTHAARTILEKEMPYLIKESISTYEYIQGVCINGYKILNGDTYQVATATLSADFNDKINTPQKHVENPNELVSAKERADFAEFVKSIKLQ